MLQRRQLLPWLLVLVLVASYSVAPSHSRADSEAALILLDTIETGGQPSTVVVDRATAHQHLYPRRCPDAPGTG